MQRAAEAQQAIVNLNGFAVQGKLLQVSFKSDKGVKPPQQGAGVA